MTLNTFPQFPSHGVYVLKLHRDAVPEQGRLCGRLVHMASGDSTDFGDSAELVAWLQRHAAELWPVPNHPVQP